VGSLRRQITVVEIIITNLSNGEHRVGLSVFV